MEYAGENAHSATDAIHLPAQLWSYRVPSPPRVNVPPPALDDFGIPEIHLEPDSITNFETNGLANIDFLKAVTYDHLVTTNAMLDWKYEQRRQAQQILPFLWLGPATAARDADFLQNNQITMVLAVRNVLSAQARLLGSKTAERLGIESKAIDVAGNQELIAEFPRAIDMINRHLHDAYRADQNRASGPKESNEKRLPGKILVFCETGNERSATLVVAYIMAMYSTGCVKAIQLAQAQRFAVSIDDSSKHLLQTYESILEAKRVVVQAQLQEGINSFNAEPRRNNKRTLEDVYDEMEVEDDDGNDARSTERKASAPFQG